MRASEAEERLKAADVGEDMEADEESDMAEEGMGERGAMAMDIEDTATGAGTDEWIDLRAVYVDWLAAVERVRRTSAS